MVATDTSMEQLKFAAKLPNIRYQHTPPTMSLAEVERDIASPGTVDLVTVAQAFHWFDHPKFYQQVNHVLRRPHGVVAVWCYRTPRVNESVDTVFDRMYAESNPFWDAARQMVDDEYRPLDFPFEPVQGTDHTGPFEFEEKRLMNLDSYFTYIRSWSAYQTAIQKGVDLLNEQVTEELKCAWGDDSEGTKIVRYPIFLRIGRVV